MATEYFFREFQENQQRTLEQAIQAYQAHRDASQAIQPLKGGMHWKKIRGREYLYKYRDRYGRGHSLGPRSPETEALFADFRRRRRDLADRLSATRRQLAEAARFCRAALIHRVPEPVVRLLGRLQPADLAGAGLMVIGTQALYAYEFAARVLIDTPKDSLFRADAGRRLTLAGPGLAPEVLLGWLRRADRSFQALPGEHPGGVNRDGFQVRLVQPPAARSQPGTRPQNLRGATVPAEMGDLTALLHSPKFSQVVIGRRGGPVTMTVPDPRALALNLLWRSQQADREPAGKERDRAQAMALAELILRYLPQYDFFSAQLHLFPAEVTRQSEGLVEGYELSGDLEAG